MDLMPALWRYSYRKVKDMISRRCKCCIMPETRNRIILNQEGICNICAEYKKSTEQFIHFTDLDAQSRMKILKKKISRLKGVGDYDSAVALSGGKDSTMALYIAKEVLHLNPLAIFVDNGFALPEMYANVKNATDILGVDLIQYKAKDFFEIFKIFLNSGKQIYYCRVCHTLLDYFINDICRLYGIPLVLGGYTKGQNYITNSELFWIYEISDNNMKKVLGGTKYEKYIEMLSDPKTYMGTHFKNIAHISPFKYVNYADEKILSFLTSELKFVLPKHSWPELSTNCSFNFISQILAQKEFGYSQHETELSDLIRCGEMSRKKALQICYRIGSEDLKEPLQRLGMTIGDFEKIYGGIEHESE